MNVYLDDTRETPDGWVRCYVPEEVIELLKTGKVEELSLDYDLGFRGDEQWRTGEVVLKFIEEEFFLERANFAMPKFTIHSSNVVGGRRLERAIETILRREAERVPEPEDA